MSRPGAEIRNSARGTAAAIFGCRGTALAADEAAFFRDADPFGFILFARNVETPDQVRSLVADLRGAVGRADAPVLIDQEGGRVCRLKPPFWRAAPAAAALARARDPETAVYLNARLIGRELSDLGITVDCAPVLDLSLPETHGVIGERAYAADPAAVAALGRQVCRGLRDEGVHPVIKHIPGHGRARADSHLELPRVSASWDDLVRADFAPFAALADEDWAMTAHIVFAVLDAEAPVTLSEAAVSRAIRGAIGFSGLLMSDDLSMKALSGGFADRAKRALAAGCDMVLHCNGDMGEMAAVMAGTKPLSPRAWARFRTAEARRLAAPAAAPDIGPAAIAERCLAALLGGKK